MLEKWLNSGSHLPKIMRDFHDQKDIFKGMHHVYSGSKGEDRMPSWITGHIYVIDWFLWFMASRGYTLQKSRKKVKFRDFPDLRQDTSPLIKSIHEQ